MPSKDKRDRSEAQARYRAKIKLRILEDRSKGCMDCGEKDVVVLQHHHRVPSEKSFGIGRATGTMSLARLELELAKCDVVCANCHLRRHAREKVG